jgi:primase-polymerase (primpol)-like protein
MSGLGFVLTYDDPYTFVDLDDGKGDEAIFARQQKVFSELPSYAERSPSGTGLHIICKGRVGPPGRKRAQIEVYSGERFMTMTGDVYRDAPIVDCQEKLQLLWQQMGGPAQIHIYGGDSEQKEDDATIIGRAIGALNGDKFKALLEGRWDEYYSSQSEADFALIDIIAFYTQNRDQITRIFRQSALGARDKAKRNDYVVAMINRAFDRQLPDVDVEGLESPVRTNA